MKHLSELVFYGEGTTDPCVALGMPVCYPKVRFAGYSPGELNDTKVSST
jgi:hypothetical protein